MANEWKITLFFNSENSGWTETYYTQAVDAANAQNKGLSLFNIRQSMCPLPTKGVFLRVTAEGFNRRSRLLAVGAGTNFPLSYGSWESQSDLVGACCFSTLYAGSADVQRPYILRGLPDNCFDRLDPTNGDAVQFRTRIDNILRPFLIASPWYIKSRGGPLVAKNPVSIVDWVNRDNTLDSTITLAGAIVDLVPGKSIIIAGTGSLVPAPGIIKVLGFGTLPTTLIVKFSLPEDYTYAPGYGAYLFTPTYPTITDLKFEKYGHRNTGRPFGGSRGRRPARAR